MIIIKHTQHNMIANNRKCLWMCGASNGMAWIHTSSGYITASITSDW